MAEHFDRRIIEISDSSEFSISDGIRISSSVLEENSDVSITLVPNDIVLNILDFKSPRYFHKVLLYLDWLQGNINRLEFLLARATIECRMGWYHTADVAFDVYAIILGTHRDVFDARSFLRQYSRSKRNIEIIRSWPVNQRLV